MTEYTVVILPGDRRPDADRVKEDLLKAVTGLSGRNLTVTYDLRNVLRVEDLATAPIAVVAFSPSTAEETRQLDAMLPTCRKLMVPVLPVYSPDTDFTHQTHPGLHRINGYPLVAGSDPTALVDEVMRLVGLSEPDRRIFLSYARSDGSALARQLRYALLDAGWSVFLDTVDIPYAVDFQARLDEKLAEMAFVLLVATQNSFDRPWIAHEIAFAQMHTLGIMAMLPPRTNPPELYAVDPAFLMHVTKDHVDNRARDLRVKSRFLTTIVNEIGNRHAAAFRTRREALLADVKAQLVEAGRDVEPTGEWTLLATGQNVTDVVCVTARPPEPRDLREAELQRKRHRALTGPTRAWIVHPLDDVNAGRASLVAWLSRRRRVQSTPVMLLRQRLTT